MDDTTRSARRQGLITLRIMIRTVAMCSAVLALVACASPGMPPGGPVDKEAPQIVKIVPDSAKTGTTPKEVIFRFDEVVSERPSGAASLDALFLISPREGAPRVDWHREEISVRPRRGWRKNTAYTITMLPGLSDLRGNTRNTGAVTMFATGATIPSSRISGVLYNWPEARAINRAGLVQAWPRGDTTLMYIATTDSAGAYTLPTLQPGEYVVRGLGDDNNNRGLDRREPWDTVAVTLRDTVHLDLLTFVHDSLGARLQTATLRDSVTIDLSFDNALSISQPLTPSQVRVLAPDSTDLGVTSVTPPAPDTAASVRKIGRPIPPRTLTIKLARPVRPKTSYRIRVTGVRNLFGVPRNGEFTLAAPETLPVPAPPPAARPPAATAPPPAPAPIKR
jgi:hypothetical protein